MARHGEHTAHASDCAVEPKLAEEDQTIHGRRIEVADRDEQPYRDRQIETGSDLSRITG